MGTAHRKSGGLVLAFLAGALLSGLTVMSLGERGPGGAPPAPDEPGPVHDERDPPLPDAPSVGDLGIDRETLGAPATEEELRFLRAALAAERERLRKQAEDDAVRARETAVRPGDDGLGVLNRYLEFDADVSAVLADYQTMRSHIRTADGPLRRIEATDKRTKVDLSKVGDEVAVIEFGEGVFVLDRGNGGWNVKDEVVESLEIRGAGMDRTTLIGPGWAFLCAADGGTIRNLSIHDLTIDALEKGQMVLDARDGIAASLERVRIAGWEVAGHAAPLGVTGNAYLACRDCEFLGPGDGWVLSLRGPALALFLRCRFTDARGAFIANSGEWRPAIVRVKDCTFENTRLTDRKLSRGGKGGAVVEVRGGRAAVGSSTWTREKRLGHFNAAFASSITGLTFTNASPRFSMADAIRALDLAAATGLMGILRLEVQGTPRGAPVELDLYVRGETVGSRPVRHTRLYDGARLIEPKEEPRRGQSGVAAVTAREFASILPLRDLSLRAPIAADESVRSLSLRPIGKVGSDEEATRKLVWSVDLVGGGGVGLDAVTGEEVWRR